MRIEAEALARGVSPEQAFAWWSDFREGGLDHEFVPKPLRAGSRRRILRREPGLVEMVDRAGPPGLRFVERTVARLEPPARVAIEGENNFARFFGDYSFDSQPQGTRVRVTVDVVPKRGLRLAARWASPLVRRFVAFDLRGHVRELERELGASTR